jgi:hypothetical protein
MKGDEEIFKLACGELQYDKADIKDQTVDKEKIIKYSQFLENKFRLKTILDIPEEEILKKTNEDLINRKLKLINEIVDNNNVGFKFRKQYEEMKSKIKLPEKVAQEKSIKKEEKKTEEKKEESKKNVNLPLNLDK